MKKMMEYLGYHACVEYDDEDEIFVGKVFGITDSLSFHGTSVDELKEMFHQSIDNYLEACKAFGREPDKEFKGSFNVRIGPDLHRLVAQRAFEEGIALNQYVINALNQSLREQSPVEVRLDLQNLFDNISLSAPHLGDLSRLYQNSAESRREEQTYVLS